MSFLAQLRAAEADNGVVAVRHPQFQVTSDLFTKMPRATPDGRVDLIDMAENVCIHRDAAKKQISRLFAEAEICGDSDSPQILQQTVLGFPLSAFSRVRWEGQRGAGSLVAKFNVAVKMLNTLRTRGGDDVKAALATQFTRAVQACAGLSDAEIQALEEPTLNQQLTNAVAAAAGVPVLPETLQQAPVSTTVTTGDTNATNNAGDVNVTVHAAAPKAPSDDGQGSGTELQTVPTNRLLELAMQPDNPNLQGFAMRMLALVERSAVAQTCKKEVELKKGELEAELLAQRKEHTEADHKRKAEHETALAEQKTKHARKMNTLAAITATHKAAAELKTLTPRLRHELSEQLVANLAGGGAEAATAADGTIHIPKIFTAKSYAEHLRGSALTDADEIKALRSKAVQIFQQTFKQPATRLLPQESEGMHLVAQFRESDLQHRAFRTLFAPYRSTVA